MQESRLVTLTGAGGVGKTRVALAVGEAMLADGTGGVWFVELAALARGTSVAVADAIARALSIEPSAGVASIDSLRLQLKGKSLVVMLDNCEHLVSEAATVADTLLRDCHRVRILATSREPLRIAGERTYRLPSLQVPPADDSRVLDAAAATSYASIELFTQRAQAVDFAFRLTDEIVPFVAEICRRVDGIPLAIELAAARVKILPPSALATKLESHLRILAGGDRMALPRHRTMHALIDWSYDLLERAEQRLFERLSVFSGGCALPEAVAVYDDESFDEVGVLDLLSSLIDKSLVFVDATGPQPRYALLQTFAQYGWEKLSAHGEATLASRRHAVAYLDLAERLEADYDAMPSTSWYALTEREVRNWHAALEWTLEARHDVLLGQRLVGAMRHVWLKSEAASHWLQIARELVDEGTPQTVVAELRYAAAHINFEFGDFERTVVDCHELSKEYEDLGDPLRAARLKSWEGTALAVLGRDVEAAPLLASALNEARKHADRSLAGYVLRSIAQMSFANGDVVDGRRKYAEAIAIYESSGAERNAALARMNLAESEFLSGNVEHAIPLATSNLIAMRQIGTKTDIALQLVNLAGYCISVNRWTAAHAHAREAVQVARHFQHHVFFVLALHRVAVVAALSPTRVRQPEAAAQLFGYADATLTRRGYSHVAQRQPEYDRALAALREAYGEDELNVQLTSGAAMEADQAVELALSL